VTIQQEEGEEDEGPRRDGAAPGSAQMPAPGPGPALVSAPAPAPAPAPALNRDAPPATGAGASAVEATLVKEEEAFETLGQQRDRLALAHGPVRVDCHIKVEDCSSADDTDGEVGEGVGPGGEGGDGEVEKGGLGGEGELVLLAGTAHVHEGDGGAEGGAPRRSTPADTVARAKRGRGDVAAADDVPGAPTLKRQNGGAQAGKSGRHGVHELIGRNIRKATPWLKWRAQLSVPGDTRCQLGCFPTADDAARAYDTEVRRRGWVNERALNFPQPEELAAYAQAEERCDERGRPLTIAPPAASQGASSQRQLKLSSQKPGKSGFFGVMKNTSKNNGTPWRTEMSVPNTKVYVVGYFATKEEAARAYDAEVRRRGWTHLKRLNFPDPAVDDAALLPSSAAAGVTPGPV